MEKKYINWKTKGMNRDMSVSAFNPEFTFENVNLRLATNEGNTMMSWVNERGTKELRLHINTMGWVSDSYVDSITGVPVGTAVLNHKLVVFTVSDFIYVFEKSKDVSYDLEGKILYKGNLKLSPDYPIETLVSYESDNVQKVYWTDNLNQPRVINIVGTIEKNNDNQFDFVPKLQLKEKISVSKMFGTGEFPPGVIQYAFTYYNKYGQESNIFHTTPLQYISYIDRGGAPDGKIANAFKIKVANVDKHFDYLRIYSILRTSLNATPLVKRVTDLPIPDSSRTNTSLSKVAAFSSTGGSNLDDFGKTMTINNIAKFKQIDNYSNGLYVQGAACSGKYLFQAYIGGKLIDVINLETKQKQALLTITNINIDTASNHGNVLSFGSDVPSGSAFPYLYYSCEAVTEPKILVIKITQSGANNNAWTGEVVQKIYLPESANGASQNESIAPSNTFTHYYQNGCVDARYERIVVSGYTMNSYNSNTGDYADNKLAYKMYRLPKVSEGYIYFSHEDVNNPFMLPFKKGTQGMVIRDGKLYQCFGYDKGDIYDEFLDCIDLSTKQIVHSYNFPKEQLKDLGEELESPYIYEDNIYLSATCNGWRYYTLWSISFNDTGTGGGGTPGGGSGGGTGGGDGTGGGVIVNPSVPDAPDDREVDISFIDTGLQGDTIDPTELLYKGGEEIKVKTMEQKDGTLFLGNLATGSMILSPNIKNTILSNNDVTKSSPLANDNILSAVSKRCFTLASLKPFEYINTLSSPEGKTYDGAVGFKGGEYYRLGVQFQYKNGKWSEPCWIGDKKQTNYPTASIGDGNGYIAIPEFQYILKNGDYTKLLETLWDNGYRKARPVFAVPKISDRTILLQGIGCPTMYRNIDRNGVLYGSASWLFRTITDLKSDWNVESSNGYTGGGYITDQGRLESQFDIQFTQQGSNDPLVSPYLSSTEIMGTYDDEHKYRIDRCLITLNSPDIGFDDAITNMDFKGCDLHTVGYTPFDKTYGDIDIQTSTPTIGSDSGGFIHKSVVSPGSAALISGLYYEDYLVDDLGDDKYSAYHTSSPPVKFPIFMWHKNGSLNNDVSRSNRSADLLKKKISNYRLGGTTKYVYSDNFVSLKASDIQLFNADFLSVVKVNGHTYQGNVDTMVSPSKASAFYFAGDPWRAENDAKKETRCYYKLGLKDPNNTDSRSGVWKFEKGNSGWDYYSHGGNYEDIGDKVKGLSQWREGVSIKYKSSPHIVAQIASNYYGLYAWENGELGAGDAPIIEVYREYDKDTLYGGTSDEALQAATWIPCGPAVSFDRDSASITLYYKWGDTYFQRYECLKTYPFTKEDKNQVVEIASFMVETRVNIDGRYDRNRAQVSNLNMSPQNFNLMNPVYSQMDNFFSYKILPDDAYKNTIYPNTITWTKTKQNGADIDLWTNITMANTLEMDGNKGEVNKIIRFNNQLLSFQDSGISQILYNENTQISTTEGVPIEIANSQKVQGKRYYSDTVGCSNKWSVVSTPAGIYFMDSNEKSIYLFNGQLNNLSTVGGFNSWAKQNIPSSDAEWYPYNTFENFVTYYDKLNQDILFINSTTALAYSEKFNCFTSFYDYGNTPYFINLDDMGIWVKRDVLYQHQAGEYCKFFGENKPFSMTLIGNQEPLMDKTFTNLEFRACVENEGTYDESTGKFSPTLPFDTLEVWNEYQHGILSLHNRVKGESFTHGNDNGILARKFRMWRCDIPRDNATVNAVTEAPMGIKRFKARPLDRIRNPWAYIKLTKNAASEDSVLNKTEVHDIMATYFG